MQFFGLLGMLVFLAGFTMVAYLIVAKIIFEDYSLSNRPPFYLALTCMVIGTMFFLTGFIAELVVRNAPERNSYLIEQHLKL